MAFNMGMNHGSNNNYPDGTRRGGGCTDTSPPEHYTAEQLSRVSDMLYNAKKILGDSYKQKVWETLPEKLRFEYNWSTWTYTVDRGGV